MSSVPHYSAGPASIASQPQPQPQPQPVDLQLSVKLWFASIAASVVGGILAFAMPGNASGLTGEQADLVFSGALVTGVLVSLAGLALRVFFVFKLKAGRNWARIVLAVLGGLGLLFSWPLFSGGFSAGLIANVIGMLLVIGAIVLMFRPASNAYFAARKAG